MQNNERPGSQVGGQDQPFSPLDCGLEAGKVRAHVSHPRFSHSSEHPPARGSNGLLSCPRGGLLLRSTQGPRGSRGASARLTPTPRPRAGGAGRRLEAEPPGVSGDHGAAPEAGGALLKGFGTIRRKRKEGRAEGKKSKEHLFC